MTRAAERRTGKDLHLLYLKLHLVSWQGNQQRIFLEPRLPWKIWNWHGYHFFLSWNTGGRREGICEADLSTVTHAYHHHGDASNLDNKVKLGVNLPHTSLKAKQSLSWPGVRNPRSSMININGPWCSLIFYWLQGTFRSQSGCNGAKYIINNE